MKTPYLDDEIEILGSFKNPIFEHIEQLQEYKAIKERLLSDEELKKILG